MGQGGITKSRKRHLSSGLPAELAQIEEVDLEELIARFPEDWAEVGRELTEALAAGRIEKLGDLARQASASADQWRARLRGASKNQKLMEQARPHLVRRRLWLLALDQCALAAAAGQASGKIRFNVLNGLLIQRLLFRQGLERKPASLAWFRLCWPLVSQKRILMPLVQSRGIFCFYSGRLLAEIAALIAGRSCLEIAAGDGTLSRLLTAAGVSIRATDDFSWSHVISFPADVEKMDAAAALKQYHPKVVICSWPPPANPFEQQVFMSPSVELYLVIGSRHPFASGNRQAYAGQKGFNLEASPRLGRYVLPPELDSEVLIFRRGET